MYEVRLSEKTFLRVKELAAQYGQSVDSLVEKAVLDKIEDQSENFDHLFTSEVLADLDRIVADLDAGAKTYSTEEVEAHLEVKRKEWREKHAS